jgi:inhibitor of cysteine peptidase
MRQGPIYVDEVELVMMESFPVQVRLILRGSLPNPCSSFAWEVVEPDSQGRIAVQAYSLQEADLACIQVLEPMEESIPLGAFTQGNFSVWLNGERVSEFEL